MLRWITDSYYEIHLLPVFPRKSNNSTSLCNHVHWNVAKCQTEMIKSRKDNIWILFCLHSFDIYLQKEASGRYNSKIMLSYIHWLFSLVLDLDVFISITLFLARSTWQQFNLFLFNKNTHRWDADLSSISIIISGMISTKTIKNELHRNDKTFPSMFLNRLDAFSSEIQNALTNDLTAVPKTILHVINLLIFLRLNTRASRLFTWCVRCQVLYFVISTVCLYFALWPQVVRATSWEIDGPLPPEANNPMEISTLEDRLLASEYLFSLIRKRDIGKKNVRSLRR